jgi:hypothetical protein
VHAFASSAPFSRRIRSSIIRALCLLTMVPRACAFLAASGVLLCASHAAKAEITLHYVGRAFDPTICTPSSTSSVTSVRCEKGSVHVQLQFSGDLPPRYTGVWDGTPELYQTVPSISSLRLLFGTMFVAGFPSVPVSQIHLSFQDGFVVRWAIIAVNPYSSADCTRLGYYSTDSYDRMEVWGPGCPHSVVHKGISVLPAKWMISTG